MRLHDLILAASLVIGTTGCAMAGHVVASFDYSLEVIGKTQDGKVWAASPSEIVYAPDATSRFPGFSVVTYTGPTFSWRASIGGSGFGGPVTSKIQQDVCFRFDEARVSSSQQPIPQDLRATFQRVGPISAEANKQARRAKSLDEAFKPQPQCFGPAGSAFTISLDLRKLFRSSNMFDAQWKQSAAEVIRSGKGNWFRVQIPIEYEGKREEVTFTFTAKQTQVSMEYW